ncbi:MAG: DUF167 domain-containing protein [Patescibacteria group bacterium]|jgi:hypothetical protein
MWYYEKDGGVILQVKVIPGARQPGVIGVLGDFLKIKITARAEKGKANDALTDYLAKRLDIARSEIYIVRGHTQPLKLVFVPVAPDDIQTLIQ